MIKFIWIKYPRRKKYELLCISNCHTRIISGKPSTGEIFPEDICPIAVVYLNKNLKF